MRRRKETLAQPTGVVQLFSIYEPDLERLLKGCPILRDSFNHYQFLHASLIDYFVMTVVMEQSLKGKKIPIEKEQKENKYEPSSQGLLDEDEEENYIVQSLLPRNTLRLSADSLKEDTESSRALRQYYADLIERSKTDASVAVGAANAMSILNAAGENFSHRNYSDVRIPGADLSGGLFNQTQFIRADLSLVSFRGAWLYQADFQLASLKGVDFGEEILLTLDDEIKCDAFSPHSCLLAVGYEFSQMIYIYDVSHRKLKSILQGHLDQVTHLAWDLTGTRLASASDDCTVRIWDVEEQKECSPKIEFEETIKALVWDGEGRRIACLERVLEVGPRRIAHLEANSISILEEGRRRATCLQRNNISVFLVETGDLLARWRGRKEEIKTIAWNSQKDLIALSSPHQVHLWDAKSENLMDFKGDFKRDIYLLPSFIPGEQQALIEIVICFRSSNNNYFLFPMKVTSSSWKFQT